MHYLLFALLVVGLIIQFEVAFGGPILVLTTIYLLFSLYKKKKFKHLLSFFILLIPFSTYIIFDLRHNFLQTRSVITQFGHPTGTGHVLFLQLLQNRYDGLTSTFLNLDGAPVWLIISTILLFAYIGLKAYKTKKFKQRRFFLLFFYFYLFYWPLSFYINGSVLWFHVAPFLPIGILILSASYLLIRKEIAITACCVMLIFYLNLDASKIALYNNYSNNNAGSWLFNYHLAQKVYKTVSGNFGFYVFTPDEWGYGPRYALLYTQKEFPNYQTFPNTKLPNTVIVLAPTENGPNNNRQWWIKNRVRIISSAPIKIVNYANGYQVQYFHLSSAQIAVPSDPNLVNGLFFR